MHPFDRTTVPTRKNTVDMKGKYSWSTAVRHSEEGRLEAGGFARQMVAGGKHGESWQHHDPLVLDMFKSMKGPSLLLRHFARMHETVKLYRQAERCLRELRLNDPWYIKPTERDGRGWGATEAIRGALCHWIEVQGGKIKNYQIIAPTTWNVGPQVGGRRAWPDGGSADRRAYSRSARSGRGRARLPLVRLMPSLHGTRPRREDRGGTRALSHRLIINSSDEWRPSSAGSARLLPLSREKVARNRFPQAGEGLDRERRRK